MMIALTRIMHNKERDYVATVLPNVCMYVEVSNDNKEAADETNK